MLLLLLAATLTGAAQAQTVKVVQNVNLRPDPSIEYKAIRLLKPTEPPLTLIESDPQFGYYHVKTQAGEEGYVWSHFVQVVAAPATSATAFHPDTGVAGSAEMVGCGDGLWKHVYHPSRLIVKQDCVTITGKIVDATAPHHHADGVRHEADGDTHGWLQVDPQFAAARPHHHPAGRHARRDHRDLRAGKESQEVERDSSGVENQNSPHPLTPSLVPLPLSPSPCRERGD